MPIEITLNSPRRMTLESAAIGANTSGNNSLVAAQAGRQIIVHQMCLVGGGAVNCYFTSGAGGSVIFGGSANVITLAGGGDGFILPFSEAGWMWTAAGQALNLNLSGAVIVSGGLLYSLL